METSSITSSNTSVSITGKNSLAENFDTFLKLLTTQLQYQDPLAPMDTTEFTNQMTQFSQVEQAINTNAQLKSLIALQQTNQSLGALGYLGRTIEATSGSVSLSGSKATILYSLPAGAAKTVLTIRDGSGGLVRTISGETGAGRHQFAWDGKNDKGSVVANGAYKVAVTALDSEGNVIKGSLTGLVGTVKEVITESDPVVLMVGDVPIEVGDIVAIRE